MVLIESSISPVLWLPAADPTTARQSLYCVPSLFLAVVFVLFVHYLSVLMLFCASFWSCLTNIRSHTLVFAVCPRPRAAILRWRWHQASGAWSNKSMAIKTIQVWQWNYSMFLFWCCSSESARGDVLWAMVHRAAESNTNNHRRELYGPLKHTQCILSDCSILL